MRTICLSALAGEQKLDSMISGSWDKTSSQWYSSKDYLKTGSYQ